MMNGSGGAEMSKSTDTLSSQEDESPWPYDVTAEESEKIRESQAFAIAQKISHEIIDEAINKGYRKFLADQSYAYVVHCSYLAWVEFFEKISSSEGFIFNFGQSELPVKSGACDTCTCRKDNRPKRGEEREERISEVK
ncbi:uncharacterized protein LOC135163041 [Diachasmimorpha longicaudata]|uniref:uncharacterized protein LOC135163041 n=1 Tax=Diachasmimorpha longicaudata TaxID=58733 RepID=UPI0030B8A83E